MHETMKKLRVRRQWPRCRARKFAKWFSVDVHDYAQYTRHRNEQHNGSSTICRPITVA